jgi:hypothetical protein
MPNLPERAQRYVINMRPRRFVGIAERVLLGAAMRLALSVVEWRLNQRMKDRRE